MTVLWPQVVTYLNTNLPSLWSGVAVSFGPPVGEAPQGDYATVGYTVEEPKAGDYKQQTSENGISTDETGYVFVEVTCQTGNDALPSDGSPTALAGCMSRLFGFVNSLDTHLRGDQTLGGLLSVNGTVDMSSNVAPYQNNAGTALGLVLTVSYFSISWS